MNKYKRIETEIDSLVKKNRSTAVYDIACKVVGLLKDADQYAEAIGIDVSAVSSHLESRFLGDFAVGIEELTIIVEHRPQRESWDKPLRQLYDEVCNEVRGEQPKRERAAPQRVTRKEHEATVEELASAKTELRHLRDQVSALSEENRRLLRENATLEGRIVELERVAGRQVANR